MKFIQNQIYINVNLTHFEFLNKKLYEQKKKHLNQQQIKKLPVY